MAPLRYQAGMRAPARLHHRSRPPSGAPDAGATVHRDGQHHRNAPRTAPIRDRSQGTPRGSTAPPGPPAKTDEQVRAELGKHTHPADVDEVTAETDSAARISKTDEAPSWQFVDGATFILDIPTTIPALWGEGNDVLWAEGESLMIAGPMGLGKTTLAGLLTARAARPRRRHRARATRYRTRDRQHPATSRWTGPPRSHGPHAPACSPKTSATILRERLKCLEGPAAGRPRQTARHCSPRWPRLPRPTTVYLDSRQGRRHRPVRGRGRGGLQPRAAAASVHRARSWPSMHHTTKRRPGRRPTHRRRRHLRLGVDHQRHRLDHPAHR